MQVDIYTAYFDPARCFPETLTGKFAVIQAGNWFPRSIHGRLHAFCAYVRCTLAAFWLAWCALRYSKAPFAVASDCRQMTAQKVTFMVWHRSCQQYDIIIVDQVSIAIPVLHLLTRSKVRPATSYVLHIDSQDLVHATAVSTLPAIKHWCHCRSCFIAISLISS